MKHLFITIHYLEIGGAERSLIGLLNSLDYTKYAVDLFVYHHRGEFMRLIPKQVNLLPEIGSYAAIEKPIVETLKEGHVGVFAARLLAKLYYKLYQRIYHPKEGSAVFQYVADCVTPVLPSLKKYGEYDLAISFLTPHNIVKDKVLAKKKWAWIHTDYSTIQVNIAKELPIWDAYDKIFAVSEGVKDTFLKTFPTLANKVDVFENILSETFIREQANSKIDNYHANRMESQASLSSAEVPPIITEGNSQLTIDNSDKALNPKLSTLNLLSVGRFTEAKNFDNVPDICKRINSQFSILNSQYRVKWYLIGFGRDEALIRENIEKTGMQNYCVILGKKTNPYPYIKTCDVYIQPSRYEGKAVTVREAQILCKPVIIANYKTAHSQVQDGIDGIIVPQSNDEMADAIVAFLRDKQKRQQIIDYLQTHHYGNENEVKKLDGLI